MFKEKTLFILGAGASFPYGYPLGKKLIRNIIHSIRSDYLNLPTPRHPFNTPDNITLKFKLPDISRLISAYENAFNTDSLRIFNQGQPLLSFNGYDNVDVQLSQINEFNNLAEALEAFDPVSIDAFLNNHPSHAAAGKIMIVYELLKCESISAFKMKGDYDSESSINRRPDNWYSYLIADILAGCNNAADIAQNQLNIITFNYDLSLDYCLSKKLSTVELLKEDTAAQNYIKQLISENIHHVYGKLYNHDPILLYGKHQFTRSNQDCPTNTKRFIAAIKNSNLIRLINEERKETEHLKSLITSAKRIVIIGFGFDSDNLSVLGFPDKFTNFNIFDGKKIHYMDYKGRMNSLADEFNELKQPFNVSVSRSTASYIVDAYQNDFKISLYQKR